jgi:cystathionine beta-lyase
MAESVRAPSLAELRRRTSVKWRQYPSDVLPMPVAEMDFPIATPIADELRRLLDRSDTGYLGPFPELFEAFSDFADWLWSWRPDPSQMRIATDVGVGVVEVIRTLINPGDRVVINAPVYDNMWRWVSEVKAELVNVPLRESGLEYALDLDALEAAYSSGATVHLLCHPHNPVGIIHSKGELQQIADLAVKYGVTVITDEIFAPLTYEKGAFHPFLSVSENARAVGIKVTSASKAFNIAGLKCALIITQSPALREKINSMPISVAFRASLFGAAAATVAFRDCRDWLTGALDSLAANRVLIGNLINSLLPSIGYRTPDFGYLAWLDLSALNLGIDPSKTILERGRLALNAGTMYSPAHPHFARLNFGTSPEIITEAFHRIARSL